MLDLYDRVQTLIKSGRVCIDNNVFTLHYRLTVLVLMLFTFIVGSSKYFGDPIDCTATNPQIERYVDNFCWFNSYIIVPKEPGTPYEPGIYPSVTLFDKIKDVKNHPRYKLYYLRVYQWIEFILFFQAVAFYVPRYLWRHCWEQGRVKNLTENFRLVSFKQDDDRLRSTDIIKYFLRNKYDHFDTMGLSWNALAHDLLTSDSNHEWTSQISLVFPNLARCEVITPAGGGNIYIPELCVLPINIFTTKIYIFLWFYFLGLSVFSGIALIYRLVTVISPTFRCFILKRTGRTITNESIGAIKTLSFSNWFVLCLVGKNMDPFSFKNLVAEYNDSLIAARPSFALVSNDKLLNADFAAMHRRRDSEKTTPKF